MEKWSRVTSRLSLSPDQQARPAVRGVVAQGLCHLSSGSRVYLMLVTWTAACTVPSGTVVSQSFVGGSCSGGLRRLQGSMLERLGHHTPAAEHRSQSDYDKRHFSTSQRDIKASGTHFQVI